MVDVGHYIMPQVCLELGDACQVDLVTDRPHGCDCFLGDGDAQVSFRLSEGDPQVPPDTGLPDRRENIGHFRRRVAFDQRMRIAVLCG